MTETCDRETFEAIEVGLEKSLLAYCATLRRLKPSIDDKIDEFQQIIRQLDNVLDQIKICQR